MNSKPQQVRAASLSDMLAAVARHAQSGRIADADALLHQILHAAPDQPEALSLLSLIQHQAGRTDLAVQTAERALSTKPDVASTHANLVVMHRKLGNLPKAIEHGRKAITLKPEFADAHYNLGLALFDAGETDAAIQCYDRAVALNARFAEAIGNRGVALHKFKRLADAEIAYRKALEIKPSYPEALNNLGTVLRDQGKTADAVAAYEKAIALRPSYVDALNNLLLAHKDLGQFKEAVDAARAALRASPNDKSTLAKLAAVYLDAQMPEEAIATLKSLISAGEVTAEIYDRLGRAYFRTNDVESAVAAYRQAIALQPDFAAAFAHLGGALSELGRFDDALAALERAQSLDPALTDAYLDIANAKTFRSGDDPHLRAMEIAVRDVHPDRRAVLHFALGKAYDDLQRYDEAFPHFAEGNRLVRAALKYDEREQMAFIDATMAAVTAKTMRECATRGSASDLPVFVVGMPRSGTTLVEQIIASHPKAAGAGEINDFNVALDEARRRSGAGAVYPDFLQSLSGPDFAQIGDAYVTALARHAPHAARIVDKAPQNMFFVGLIHMMLPNARIIHVTRDPLDTSLSCYTKMFTGWHQAYDLAELGRFYKAYRRLMDHWRSALSPGAMLEVQYENLIGDTETTTRRILDHCGLDWSDSVREFYNLKRAVKTASAAQVRRPIYTSAVGRWRHYEKHLAPLIAALQG